MNYETWQWQDFGYSLGVSFSLSLRIGITFVLLVVLEVLLLLYRLQAVTTALSVRKAPWTGCRRRHLHFWPFEASQAHTTRC